MEKKLRPIVFEEMTIRQKIGFVMCGGSWRPLVQSPDELEFHLDLIRKRALGSIWVSNNLAGGAFQETIRRVREAADYPILIMTDTENGFQEDTFGASIALGYINDEAVAYAVGKGIGIKVKRCGFDMVCLPLLDRTDGNAPCGAAVRTLHPDREVSARLAAALARGVKDAGVLTCAKHYPSCVRVPVDTHMAEAVSFDTRDKLVNDRLYAYRTLNDLGLLDAVMTGHTRLAKIDPEYPASMSGPVISILRKEIGFDGIAVTDALGMMGVVARFGLDEPRWRSILAGNDIALGFDKNMENCYRSLMTAYERGDLPIERIDAAVKRVIQCQNKTLERPKYTSLTPEEEARIKGVNKNSIAVIHDAGVSPVLSTTGRHLFVVLSEEAADLSAPVENDSMNVSWYAPAAIAGRIRQDFPNSDVTSLLIFPPKSEISALCSKELEYDDVVFVTFFDSRPYVGDECFTSRILSIMKAWQITNRISAIVHCGNPFLLEETPHIPIRISACKSAACTLNAIDVLAGKYVPSGRMPYRLHLQ